jgi:putative ABC transport system substrate-binding protein
MKRREFISLLGGAAATWPLAAHAQQIRTLRLGIVAGTPRAGPLWVAFEQHLRQLGYVDGQNLKIEFIQVDLQDDTIHAAMTKIVSSERAIPEHDHLLASWRHLLHQLQPLRGKLDLFRA